MTKGLKLLAVGVVASLSLGLSALAHQPSTPLVEYNWRGDVVRTWTPIEDTDCYEAGRRRLIPEGATCTPPPPSTTVPPPTTTLPPTATVPPTTTTPTTTSVPPTTTQPPQTSGFVESFDNDSGLDSFDTWVYQRNVDIHDFWGFSGGSWTGDHGTTPADGFDCGGPATQRPLSWSPGHTMDQRRANSFYVCRDHLMTSMGDVDGYSIVTFSPAQTFASVSRVCVNVNLTDLGSRQWWKIGVVTAALYDSTVNGVPGFLMSDVSASDVPGIVGTNRLIASWGGVGAYPAKLRIGNNVGPTANPSPNDKMTRHPVCLADNGDGTITFTVAGTSMTRTGSFPSGEKRVVFYDHNYTPNKDGMPQGHTWHWDSIVVN